MTGIEMKMSKLHINTVSVSVAGPVCQMIMTQILGLAAFFGWDIADMFLNHMPLFEIYHS